MIKIGSVDADIALIYVGLGDRDDAINKLNQAFEARFKGVRSCGVRHLILFVHDPRIPGTFGTNGPSGFKKLTGRLNFLRMDFEAEDQTGE